MQKEQKPLSKPVHKQILFVFFVYRQNKVLHVIQNVGWDHGCFFHDISVPFSQPQLDFYINVSKKISQVSIF